MVRKTTNKLLQTNGTIGWSRIVGHDNQIAINVGNRVDLCHLNLGLERRFVMPADENSSANAATQSALHPDGRLVVISNGYGLRLGDALTGEHHDDVIAGFCYRVAIDSRGHQLFTFSNGVARRWPIDVDPKSQRAISLGMPEEVLFPDEIGRPVDMLVDATNACVVFHNKKATYSIFYDDRPPEIAKAPGSVAASHHDLNLLWIRERDRYLLYDRGQEEVLSTIEMPTHLASATISPDGRLAIVIGDNDLVAYNIPSLTVRYRMPDVSVKQSLVSFANNGKIALLAQNSPPGVLMIVADTGEKLAMFPAAAESVPREISPMLSYRSNRMVTFDWFNSVVTWDLEKIRHQLRAHDLDWQMMPDFSNESVERDLDRDAVAFTVDWDGRRRQVMMQLLEGLDLYHLKRLAEDSLPRKQAPFDTDMFAVRAVALMRLDRPVEAEELIKKILAIDPDDEDAALLLQELSSQLVVHES